MVYALATIVTCMVAFHRLRRLGLPERTTMATLGVVIASGFAGTYAIGVIPTAIYALQTGQIAWQGQANFAGTISGAVIGGVILCRAVRTPLGRAFDLGGIHLPLLQALGRIGCWSAGCCGGVPTTSWLGMYLPDPSGAWARRYPTQLMSGVLNLVVFAGLLGLERYGRRRAAHGGWPFDGFLFLLYVGLFCLERSSMEYLRADRVPVLGPLSWAHLYTYAGLIVVIVLMARNLRSTQENRNAAVA